MVFPKDIEFSISCKDWENRANRADHAGAVSKTKDGMNQTPIANRYMNVKGAAQYLGTTTKALYKSAQRRLVPCRKRGKLLVFDREELDAFMHALEGVDVAEAVARTLNNGTKHFPK